MKIRYAFGRTSKNLSRFLAEHDRKTNLLNPAHESNVAFRAKLATDDGFAEIMKKIADEEKALDNSAK